MKKTQRDCSGEIECLLYTREKKVRKIATRQLQFVAGDPDYRTQIFRGSSKGNNIDQYSYGIL